MTLLDLVKYLRLNILDDSGGTGVDWAAITEDSPSVDLLRWTNEELVAYINEAERRAARASLLIEDATTAAVCSITVTAGTALYTKHSKILKIKQAKLLSQSDPLIRGSMLQYQGVPNWETATGTPYGYMEDYTTGFIRLDRLPAVDDTLKLIVYRLPLADMDWATADTDAPEISEAYHIPMLNYAASLAYRKEDANILDPARADRFEVAFNREFSDTSAYSETRKARKVPRAVRYGGV